MVAGYCKHCKLSVDLEKKTLKTDNGQVVVIYEGECPICGKPFYEES